MKCLVTYASKYGSTKKYAQWIAEALACDIQDSKDVNRKLLECEEERFWVSVLRFVAAGYRIQ